MWMRVRLNAFDKCCRIILPIYIYIYPIGIQVPSQKAPGPDNGTHPKHLLRRYDWIPIGYIYLYSYILILMDTR